ncbi:MAG: cupredoxin domain-containing protein, partial [Anaerolineae bacterium]|nr:cupredoxin domain-containing protein [Anaerolineae bacterium]
NLMEDQLNIVGKAEDIAAGGTATINLTLEPGHYVLACNLPGHYSQGMHVDFTVEDASSSSTTATPPPPQTTEEASQQSTTVAVTETSYNIELDQSSAPAGDVTFQISNNASDMAHEVLVIKTDTAADSLQTDDSGNLMEDQLNIVGKAEDIAAGGTATINLTLEPGHYVLACNLPGHYSQGMHVDFTVEGNGSSSTSTSESTAEASNSNAVQVSMVEFAFRMPESVSSGQVTFEVTNDGSVPHNFRITGQGIDQQFDQNLEPGETQSMQVNLEAGTYDIMCPVDSHAQQGMRTTLTVEG